MKRKCYAILINTYYECGKHFVVYERYNMGVFDNLEECNEFYRTEILPENPNLKKPLFRVRFKKVKSKKGFVKAPDVIRF